MTLGSSLLSAFTQSSAMGAFNDHAKAVISTGRKRMYPA